MTERIECINGPAEGRKVRATMGERWPWVISYDSKTSSYMLGYYSLIDGVYKWDPDTIETGNFNEERKR